MKPRNNIALALIIGVLVGLALALVMVTYFRHFAGAA
jgi:hypothetical protein